MIKELLGVGKANIKTTHELMVALKIDNPRVIKQLVNQERKDGAVILSSCGNTGGYYLPSTDDKSKEQELKEFINTMNRRKKELTKTTASAVEELKKLKNEV